MIVSTIKQFGLRLRADPEEIPFQYSSNIQMQFIKDENYNDYTVVGYYIPPGENEAKLLSINDGTFILGPDCFKQRGTLSFSFNLINSQEEVHLGSIDFEVRYSFGDGDTILPEPEEVWIRLVAQVAKDAIKEDVALVKQKANEALQSASLANDKASEVEEYANNANQSANSASLSASSALTAKNDAIAASNSAIQAKQDAEQSANNAKNSANTALENANKSTEAIETVTQIKTEIENKANDFDTNYQEKLKSFNDNATSKQNAFDNSVQTANTNLDNKVNQANSDLDVKVQEANTIIDEKVKTATEQAQKATDEANRAEQATDGKLDKNLGVENAGKSLVVGENGEVVCGESGINEDEVNKIIDKAIDEKLYTQEEVDYLLADKMDKPYVPITITDNATIDDALAGNFKIDKIKGNTYQNVETDIVPTPDRPLPINSRKVLSNGEYVELRSLKESVNKFDLGLLSQTYLIPQTGSYRKIEIPTKLKPSVRYTFYYENFMIPALSWLVLDIINSTGNIIFTAFNVNNKNNEEIEVNGRSVAFNAPSGGEIYFNYYVQLYDEEGNLVPQSTEMFKENWFTKYVKNIMITEESLNQTTYVAPTIRDYKIVDHTAKTSKIIRNIKNVRVTPELVANKFNDYTETMKRVIIYTRDRFVIDNVTKAGNDLSNMAITRFGSLQNGNVFADVSGIANMYWYLDISMLGLNGSETKDVASQKLVEFLTSNEMYVQYQLATPVEETITYVETDTSEVGYSWQDTTSPSPTIKSEVQGVEEINILKTGKNIFDVLKFALDTRQIINDDGTIQFKPYSNPYPVNIQANTVLSYFVIGNNGSDYSAADLQFLYEDGSFIYGGGALNERTTIKFTKRVTSIKVLGYRQRIVKEFQLEQGDTATAYEPYTGQHINIALPQPMYSTLDGSIADEVDVEKGVYRYWLLRDKIENIFSGVAFSGIHDDIRSYYVSSLKNDSLYPKKLRDKNNAQNLWCDKLVANISYYNTQQGEMFSLYSDSSARFVGSININRLNKDTGSDIYNLIKDFEIVYPLLTPIEIPIFEENLKLLKSLKTNAGVNNIFINGEVKPTIEARYPQDVVLAVNKLQTKLLTLQEEVVKNV